MTTTIDHIYFKGFALNVIKVLELTAKYEALGCSRQTALQLTRDELAVHTTTEYKLDRIISLLKETK